MKINYIFSGILATAAFMLSSCAEVDVTTPLEGVGTAQLDVKGYLVSDPGNLYPSIVDPAAGTITVQVPYYISNTEPIMGDLTQMKLEAQMPVGYTFSPSLSGIHDLAEGYRTNLISNNGSAVSYTVLAEYIKSSDARIISAKLTESERTAVVVRDPASPGEHGQVIVAKTSSSIDGALREVALNVSPWSTVECAAMDPVTGYIDFTNKPQIKVTSQDGSKTTVYDVDIQVPEIKPNGVGYISAMWGIQFYTDNEYGFKVGNNTSIAAIEDYLIVSNNDNVADMIVLNRFNGRKLDVKVNTTGMVEGREFRAITHDDANHLIAASWTSSQYSPTSSTTVYIYAWMDGIDNPPTCILQKDWNDAYFAAAKSWPTRELFWNVNCRGDITTGDCVITTAVLQSYRCWFFQFKDGQPDGNLFVEYAGGVESMWAATNCAPITNKPPYGYFWHTGNFRYTVVCAPVGTAGGRAFDMKAPTSHWWNGKTLGVDYIEFNGACLLGIANGNVGAEHTEYVRLYVADVTPNPNANSLNDGFIFDSREGNKVGIASEGGPQGTGVCVTGMTSFVSYESGYTVLGGNFGSVNRAAGNVKFARSTDGNAVQAYMLVPDMGIIAYEITRFDL